MSSSSCDPMLNTTLTLLILLAVVHISASRTKFCIGDELMPNDPKVIAGQDLNVTCKINVMCHRDNSSRLYISLGWRNLSKEFITVLSEDTVEARIPGLTLMDDGKLIRCKVNETRHSDLFHNLVGNQILAVVEAPYRANMTCIDYQTSRLNCTWSYPSNFVKKPTKVIEVKYTFHHRAEYFDCPDYTNWTSADWFYFSCQLHGYPVHVPNFLQVVIEMPLMNHVTEFIYRVGVDKHSIMLANKMEAVTARALSSDTVELSWNFQFYYEPLLKFKVQYNASRWKTEAVTMFYQTSIYDQRKKSVTISGLVPNTQYTFCVTAQPNSPAALYWSNPSNVARVTTPATVPVKAPALPPGGYIWVSKSTVRIYWQALDDRDHNGLLVGYRLFHDNTTIFVNKPDQYYRDIELHGSPPYVIDLRSVNNVGQSQQYSRLLVTTSSLLFINFGVEPTQSKHIIHVLWRPPKMELVIKGYVLYLCERTISLYCSGPVHYIEVEANRTSKMLDTELLFGSGANQIKVGIGVVTTATNQSDSYWGITWSKCIYPMSSEARNVTGAMAPSVVLSNIQYSSVTVMWKHLTCDESKVWISNYILRYCEVATCHRSDPVSLSVDVSDIIRYKLSDVVPGTSYTVWVEINTTRGILDTYRDTKSNFTTRDLKIRDTDLSWDSSQVTITCPPPSRQLSRPVFVATFTVSNEEKNISSVCQTDQDQTSIKFDCDNDKEYFVNLSLHSVLNGKVVHSKPVTKRVCLRVLTTVVIVVVAISCLLAGTCIVSLGYATRRFWIKESRRVPKKFHYPDEAGERVCETVEECYRCEHDPGLSMSAGVCSQQVTTKASSSAPLLCESTSPSVDVKDKQQALRYHSLSADEPNGTYSQFVLLSNSCMEVDNTHSASTKMEVNNTHSASTKSMDMQLLPTPNLQGAAHLESSVHGTSNKFGFQVVNIHVPSIKETLRKCPNIFGHNAISILSTRDSLGNFNKDMLAVGDEIVRHVDEDSAQTGGEGGSHACNCKGGDGGSHACGCKGGEGDSHACDCKGGEGDSHACDCKGGEGDSHACDCKGGEGDSHACDCKGGEGDSHACDCKDGEGGPNATMITSDTQRIISEDVSNSDDIDSLSPSEQSCSVLSDRVKLGTVHQSCKTHDDGGYVTRDGISDRSTIMAESDSGCERTSSSGSSDESTTRDSGYTSPECQGELCSFNYPLTKGTLKQPSLDTSGSVAV